MGEVEVRKVKVRIKVKVKVKGCTVGPGMKTNNLCSEFQRWGSSYTTYVLGLVAHCMRRAPGHVRMHFTLLPVLALCLILAAHLPSGPISPRAADVQQLPCLSYYLTPWQRNGSSHVP